MGSMTRLIMHVDLDAFYASIEQRDQPLWRGLPVVVGAKPGGRGVVAACSYEARRYGVRLAMPISQAVRPLPPETVYSRPRMDDDARVSEQVRDFLDPMPLAALRGVGAKTAPRLLGLGLKTVGDVRRCPLAELRRHLGAQAGTRLHRQSHGLAADEVHPATERKSISKETTFAEDVSDARVLRETLLWAAQEVGFLARQEGLKGRVVRLKIRFRPFETHTRSRTLPVCTVSSDTIFQTAWSLLEAQPWSGRPVRLVGVGLSGWDAREGGQPDLFGDRVSEPVSTDQRLDETLDAIRRKFGKRYLQRGLGPGR